MIFLLVCLEDLLIIFCTQAKKPLTRIFQPQQGNSQAVRRQARCFWAY